MGKQYFPNYETDYRGVVQGFELDARGSFALDLIEKWGMVQGVTGEEDSTGRAKIDLMSAEMVVDRAFDMAQCAFRTLEALGWIRPNNRTMEEVFTRGGELQRIQEAARYPQIAKGRQELLDAAEADRKAAAITD